MPEVLATLDATAQADLVRRGEVTPVDLVEAAIARIEALNPQLNAVIVPLFEKARQQAASPALPRGAFRGVPFLLKDLIAHSAGDPYHSGMRFLRDCGWAEPADTFLVAKLRAAGMVLVGRTNTPELGVVPTTEPVAYGPTRNPWDLTRSTGGSSGGSAAAVAAGLVPVAHGNDGGGSIRIPASECGLVGLKPSRGRISLGPDQGEVWGGLATEHVLTRSVRDTAAMLDVLAGAMPGDPYTAPPPARSFAAEVGADPGHLRIGLLTRTPARIVDTHRDCTAAATSAARLMESLGHTVEESHPAALDDQEIGPFWSTVVLSCVARDLDYWSQRTGKTIGCFDVEPFTWAMAELGRIFSSREFIFAVEQLHTHGRRVASWWARGFDLLLTPTLAEPPPPLGSFDSTPEEPMKTITRQPAFVSFTSPFNMTGQPAISLPLHWNAAGLPIGVHLVAAYGREDLLLRVAAQLEQAQPWSHRRPPVQA